MRDGGQWTEIDCVCVRARVCVYIIHTIKVQLNPQSSN